MNVHIHLVVVALLLVGRNYAQTNGRSLTTVEVKAIVQTVADEIYDEGDYGEYDQIGENLGTKQHWKSRVHIYINSRYGEEFEGNEGTGQAIYKLMPYGEIVRLFVIKEGRVLLVGDPQNGFPITQPSHQSVLDDAEIRRLKRIWLRRSFVVDVSPTDHMVAQASQRQRARRDSER